jgi:hypothetical protein
MIRHLRICAAIFNYHIRFKNGRLKSSGTVNQINFSKHVAER